MTATKTQTGPLVLGSERTPLGQFTFRDGVWYMTPALKTASNKAHG
jgi:hypothetical protein